MPEPRHTPLTAAQAASLPPVLDAVTAGRLLGIGRTTAYRLLATGRFPAPALRVGRQWRIPTSAVCALLGLDHPATVRLHEHTDHGDT